MNHANNSLGFDRAAYIRLVKHLAWLLGSVLLLAGCNPVLYAPNTLNAPMITRKGEGNVAVHFGEEKTVSVEAAYSPFERIGVLVDVTRARAPDNPSGAGGSMTIVEAGIGRYRPFKDRFFWDAYGIAAFGGIENHAPTSVTTAPGTTGTLDANFVRYGLQPSLGWRSRFVDLAFSSRIVGLRYYDIQGRLVLDTRNVQDYLRSNRNQFLLEPALTARAGYKGLKVQAQLGHGFNVSERDFPQRNDFVSWGILYNFGR